MTRTRGTLSSMRAQKLLMPARVMAISVARPDTVRRPISSQAESLTAAPSDAEHRRHHGELADEAGQRRQPGEEQGAGDEADAEEGHRGRNGDADLVREARRLRRRRRRPPAVTASTSAPGSRTRSTSSTSRKRAPIAEGGADQIEQRAAPMTAAVADADGGEQRARRDEHAAAGKPRQGLRGQHADRAEGDRQPCRRRAAIAAEPGDAPRLGAEQQRARGAG